MTKILTKPRYRVKGEITRFDERDNAHARGELVPDTPEWKEYYQRHPEYEEGDRITKSLPGLCKVGHPWDLPLLTGLFRYYFRALGGDDVVDGPPSPTKQNIPPQRAAEKVKGFARHLGADLVRTGPLNQAFVYTHIGKNWHVFPERKKGTPISLPHQHAVVMAVGGNSELIKTGPVLPQIMEMMRLYSRLAKISVAVAAYIRGLGYSARAHNLFNYQVLCVPIAIEAGMGELGRHGIMITKEFGSCLKLAVVTTDMPLTHDSPVNIGVEEFCEQCKLCAESCPSGAVPHGGKKVVRGVEKWKINDEACFRIWNETGTDCGVCIASCPWTKPRTTFHNIAREFASRGGKAGLWMSKMERLVYGKFQPKGHPAWMEKPEPIWKKYKSLRSK